MDRTRGNWRLITQLILIGVFAYTSIQHFQISWRYPEYQFFPLLGVIVVALYFTRGGNSSDSLDYLRRLPLPYVAFCYLGSVLLLLSIGLGSTRFAFIAFVVYLGGFAWWMTARGTSMVGPWLLLWFLVRPPRAVESTLSQSLQLLSSNASSRILDLLGINHVMLGNVLRFPERELFVDQACSGVVSLFSVLAFGAVYSVWNRYSWIRSSLLLSVSLVWATILNILRITVIAIAQQSYQWNLADGTPHTVLGIALFGITIAGFYSTDRFLELFFQPIPEAVVDRQSNRLERIWNYLTEEVDQVESTRKEWGVATKSSRFLPWLSVVVSVLFVTHWVMIGNQDFSETDSVVRSAGVSRESLWPDNYNGIEEELVTRDPHSPLGAFSKVFYLEDDGTVFSLDYPFFGYWHELSGCYRANGWQIKDRSIVQTEREGSTQSWDVVRLDLKHTTSNQMAVVFFALCDINGQPVDAPAKDSIWANLALDLQMRFFKSLTGEVIQFQLFQPGEPSPVQMEARLKQFVENRNRCYAVMYPDLK